MKQRGIKVNIVKYTNVTEMSKKFFNDIKDYALIDAVEERKLLEDVKLHGSEEARNKLINHNQRFVIAIAKVYDGNGDGNLLDLINEGNIGLIKAIEKWDLGFNVRFLSYAVHYIRRNMQQYLCNHGELVRKTNKVRTTRLVNKIQNKFYAINGRYATPEEVMVTLKEEYNVSIVDSSDIFDVSYVEIDKPYDRNDDFNKPIGVTDYDIITSHNNSFGDKIDREYTGMVCDKLLGQLPPRERKIIKKTYGIGCKAQTINNIADEMGVSSERIRQLTTQALRMMKHHSKDTDFNDL